YRRTVRASKGSEREKPESLRRIANDPPQTRDVVWSIVDRPRENHPGDLIQRAEASKIGQVGRHLGWRGRLLRQLEQQHGTFEIRPLGGAFDVHAQRFEASAEDRAFRNSVVKPDPSVAGGPFTRSCQIGL